MVKCLIARTSVFYDPCQNVKIGCVRGTRPEIQATVRAPAVRNMRKAVTYYYIFAMSLWIILTYIGYWCDPGSVRRV